MKAVVYSKYGSPDDLELKEVEKATPKDDEVLVEVHAVAINAADWHLLTADIFLVRLMTGGLFKPKNTILGFDIAGRVAVVGSRVTAFQPGDEVFGRCESGGLAEYVCAREDLLALKPASATFEEAAALPMGGMTALQGLRDKGKIQAGKKVLINGASGGVGTFAVQIAKAWGAEVTAVCSTRNVDMARSLGADHVMDYTQEDFTKSGQQYDLILAANGYHPIMDYQRALNPQGIYVMAGGAAPQMYEALLLAPWLSMMGSRKMGVVSEKPNKQDLTLLAELVEARKIVPVLDRCYSLDEAAEALRYLGTGHARGKIVVMVAHPANA